MMPMGKGKAGMMGGGMGGMGGGMMGSDELEPAPEEIDLPAEAKVEAIRAALADLVDLVGGISVEDAKKRKAAPPAPALEPGDDEG